MSRPPSALSAVALTAAALLCLLIVSCGGSSDNKGNGGTSTDAGEAPLVPIEDYFEVAESTEGTIASGEAFELPDGGTVTLPQSSESDVEISVAPADLTDEATSAFADFHPDEQMEDAVYKITMAFSGSDPGYVIITRPATHENSRIFATGYVDSTTGVPDWAPVPSTFDAEAGEVTAGVGLGVFQRGPASQIRKLSAPPLAQEGQTYVGYVGVSVAGQLFKSEIEFLVEEPTDDQVVAPFDGPPIDVRGQVGARFVHITHEPLATTDVASDFGPRTPPPGGSAFHFGVDYSAATGTTVFAAGDGRVFSARCQNSSNNCRTLGNGGFIVVIEHGDGETTHYMHMTNPSTVSEDNRVTGGQSIGLSDHTGLVRGIDQAHLHFEVKKNGTQVDAELIYGEQTPVTVAMAIDMQLQEDTRQEISVKVTRGLEPADMEDYASSVAVTGVEPGFHELQFVAIKSNGSLEVLGSVPLRIEGAGFSKVTGHHLLYRDYTYTHDGGEYDTNKTVLESTFTLDVVGDGVLKGQGHVSYTVEAGSYRNYDCVDTESFGMVEWDVVYDGDYFVDEFGNVDVDFFDTPRASPDFPISVTTCGAGSEAIEYTTTQSGHGTPDIHVIVSGNEYYFREDAEFGENETGEDYEEILVELKE